MATAIATKAKPKPATARTTKKPKTKAAPEPARCKLCGHALDWRDRSYVGKDAKSSMCKVCWQKAERKRLRAGVLIPRDRLPKPAASYGADRIRALTSRRIERKPKPTPKPLRAIERTSTRAPRASRRAQAKKVSVIA